MTIDQLRIFAIVAEHLNMRRAAEILNLSQPAISAAIGALEGRNKARLFHRIGRGLELTAAGVAFLPAAQAVLRQAEIARDVLVDLSGLRSGALALFASQTVATYWLPRHLALFATAYPAVQTSLNVGNTAQTLVEVLSGRAELGFIEGNVDEAHVSTRSIGGDRLGLYVAPEHPLAGSKVMTDELKSARWILRETGSGTRDHFVSSMDKRGLDIRDLDVRLELPSNGAVLNATMTGHFVCAVSDLAAEARLKAGMLCKLDYELPQRVFKLIFHRERYLSRVAQAFKELALS